MTCRALKTIYSQWDLRYIAVQVCLNVWTTELLASSSDRNQIGICQATCVASLGDLSDVLSLFKETET